MSKGFHVSYSKFIIINIKTFKKKTIGIYQIQMYLNRAFTQTAQGTSNEVSKW